MLYAQINIKASNTSEVARHRNTSAYAKGKKKENKQKGKNLKQKRKERKIQKVVARDSSSNNLDITHNRMQNPKIKSNW
jgi:hypothetical protein